jgi:predicted ribosomally synthesized peptide with SipW-like signal peptide
MRLGTRKTAVKIFASLVLVGGAASVAGLGTFGSFTSTTSASAEVATGKVELSTGASVQGLSVAAVNMVPGDTVQRSVTLTRSSATEAFGSVVLSTTGTAGNLLTGDAANGLQLRVDQCSVAWAQGAGNQLTCPGTTTSILAQRAVVGAGMSLGEATTALNGADAAANLRVTLSLPGTAGNDFQGLSNTIKFTFDATQRAAKAL